MKRIVIAGATGFIGRQLCQVLAKDYQISILTRRENAELAYESFQWDAKTFGDWAKIIDGAFAVINLSGENIAEGRWTAEKKEKILHSRLDSSKILLEAVKKSTEKPKVAVLASAIGFYGNRGDEQLDENSLGGKGFLSDVCRQVESLAEEFQRQNTRPVIIRSGIVLGSGGTLEKIAQVFRLYMGGYLGSGKQWVSWIHIDDEINAIKSLIENENLSGVFNLTSPQPEQMKTFCEVLAKALNRPSWTSVPAFTVRLIFGQIADEVFLASQKVYPTRLLESGFNFQHPDLQTALTKILQ